MHPPPPPSPVPVMQVDGNISPLAMAASYGNLPLVRWLLARPEVDPNARSLGVAGHIALPLTALFARRGDRGACGVALEYERCWRELLADARIDVNACDGDGTPVLQALLGAVEHPAALGIDAPLLVRYGTRALTKAGRSLGGRAIVAEHGVE
jgi:hypothetical protein